ncbi:sensor histidine kinase [Desulfitibacter alkalitolerans]|uniref:sensor histidine kinase n=1 Tax=Desulfitibacter alkalitolerans TaxID=264641 RepID=UPI0004818B65|nr:sensor histidine kinase [Desulfitibacter alkalitolerans]
MIESGIIDKILKDVISRIETGKNQLYEIAEEARQECVRAEAAMLKIKNDTLEIVEQVDWWEKKEKKARLRLAEVSKNFHKFGESDIRSAYETAKDIQVQLALLREKEEHFKLKRFELEQQYKRMKQTVEKAESLVSQVGVAMKFLSSNLKSIQEEIGKIQDWQELGLAVIKAQEEERRRVARGIHDGPAQSLANIVLRIEFCEKILEKRPEVLPEELSQLKSFARKTLEEIRKILFDLRPMDLDDLGLISALKRFLMDFQDKNGIQVDFQFSGNEQIYAPEIEVAIFRIIQECINNVKKHSKASMVRVNMERAPLKINAVISDDGVGFNVEEGLQSNRFGLKGMREWARLLGGDVKIVSSPNSGTRISAVIPLKER